MSRPTCGLYLITPPLIEDAAKFSDALAAVLEAGDVRALQVRLKAVGEAALAEVVESLAPLCRSHGTTLILNDDPALAAKLDCDGVHIGQQDMPLDEARRIVGRERVIGVTCHDSRHLAMEASEGGADYVAFGAFHPTTTKETIHQAELELLEIWQETMLIPCVAIGGITPLNAAPIVAAGADFIAVSAGVWNWPEGAVAAVRAFEVAIAEGLAARADPR